MEQRRTQRYKLQLPLQILQLGEEVMDRAARTRDVSSGGVCFDSDLKFEAGARIEYVITLSGNNPPVRIRCLGKVLRNERHEQSGFEVAVTMERYSFVRSDEPVAVAANA